MKLPGLSLSLFFLGFTALSPAALAQVTKKQTVQNQFLYGYCIHLGQPRNKNYDNPAETNLKFLALGGQTTRDDLLWDIREAKSLQDLPSSMAKMSHELMDMQAVHLITLMGDVRYIREGQPNNDASRHLFADYARHAATVLRPLKPMYEIWNEWNLGAWNLDKKPGDPASYIALAKTTYPALKNAAPESLVLAGAVGIDKDWAWTQEAVSHGLMETADGLSVHIYDRCSKAQAPKISLALDRLKDLQNKLLVLRNGQETPIYLTETGWHNRVGLCDEDVEIYARDRAAQLLLEAPTLPWLKGVWFYELQDEGLDPNNVEHHFGFYRLDGSMKPVGCATKTIWDFISQTHAPAFRTTESSIAVASFKTSDGKIRVGAWLRPEAIGTREVRIPDQAKSFPFCGEAGAKGGSWAVLSRAPLLFEIPEAQLKDLNFR